MRSRAPAKQRHPRILDWSDERGPDGDPIMVTLVRGFAYYDNDHDGLAAHVLGFPTVRAALAGVRAAKPCACDRCRASLDK